MKKHLVIGYLLAGVVVALVNPAPASAGASFQGFVNLAQLFWTAVTAILSIICFVSWVSVIAQFVTRGEQLGGLFYAAVGVAVGTTLLLGVEAIVNGLSQGSGGTVI